MWNITWNLWKITSIGCQVLSKILLFLSSQIKYTTIPRDTLLILASRAFFLEINPLRALFRVDILLVILSQVFIFPHNREV